MTETSLCRYCGLLADHDEVCPVLCPANMEDWQKGNKAGWNLDFTGRREELYRQSAAFQLGYRMGEECQDSYPCYEPQEPEY